MTNIHFYKDYIDEVFVFRVVQLARDYASRRSAFGKILKDHALHVQTLARMEVRLSIKHQTQGVVFIRASLKLNCKPAGGDSRSISPPHGCVSPVGPRGKRRGNPAGYKPSTPAYTCAQTIHWEAGEQL